MKRYLTVASLCVIAAAGWVYDRDIRQAKARPTVVEAGRDGSRTDCNGNGIADEDEIHPLPGQALVFDGDDDYVDPGASEALADLAQGDFTIEAWIRTDDPGHAILVGNAGVTSRLYNFVIRGHDEGGVIRLRTVDGETSHVCDGAVTINDGAWHHVAAARWINGPGCIRLYVDGEEIGTLWGDYDMTPFTADNATLIGRDQQSSPHYFNGAMDEVRVWNVGRFMDDIKADMYRVLDGDEPGLVAYWRFDEGEGLVAYDSTGDSDGALVGSPAWAPFGYDCNNNGVLDKCDAIVDGVVYVDDDATGGLEDGLSWADAFVDLQDALAYFQCSGQVDEIRVAGGTYKPGTERGDSFWLTDGLALRGGYRGLAGGGDPGDRNIDAFESILSGDIGVVGDSDDNSHIVVIGYATDETAVIDGFTITDAENPTVQGGGGVYIGRGRYATILRCKIINNESLMGAGVCCPANSHLTAINCAFGGNRSSQSGGAMFITENARVTLTGCIFNDNSTEWYGGAIYSYLSDSLTLTNCTFVRNEAEEAGGAIGVETDVINAVMKNCIVWGNTAYVRPQLSMPINTPVTYSCIQGGWAGDSNIDADPLFVDADGPDGIFGTADDDLHLLEGSPCINAGDDTAIPEGVTTDFEGEDRIQQCRVDIGADESPYPGNDCNSDGVPDACEIANCDGSPWCGDCNNNGVPDGCDIASGASEDEDGNGVPDECELLGDCDHDFDVDLDDLEAVLGCLFGPDEAASEGCGCADSNADLDVDLADFALFQQAFTGSQP